MGVCFSYRGDARVEYAARIAEHIGSGLWPRVREDADSEYGAGTEADSASAPAPALDLDALEDLGDEICVLSAELSAGTRRLLTLIARFDAAGGWKPGGHRGCENWLSLHTGLALRTAREYLRVARALEELPQTGASMGRGALCLDQVRAVTRVASPETEADLVELAEGAPTAVLERECRAWKRLGRRDEAEREKTLYASRRLALYPEDGMYRLNGLLMPEVGASLQKALDLGRRELYRKIGKDQWLDDPREAARRGADALGLVAEWALGSGSRSGSSTAERFQVMLHVEPDTLRSDTEPGRSELEDGTRLSAETARRIACDGSLVKVEHSPEGEILNVGRRTRSIPPALRRALEVRDRGCRFPGCYSRYTDAHHLVHWADGGETSLKNTFLMCRVHHRLLHEEGWRAEWWGRDRHLVFIDPRWQKHGDFGHRPRDLRPEGPGVDPVAALAEANREAGVPEPDYATAGPRWKRESDIPDEVLFRAIEATAPG